MSLASRILSNALLAATLVLSSGCAMIDRMTGESVARPLRQFGVPAEAEILQIWDTGITVNDNPVVGMEVEVEPPGGESYRAKIPRTAISRIAIPRFQPGERIAVRFDPNDPGIVALDDPPFPEPPSSREEPAEPESNAPGPGIQTDVSAGLQMCARSFGGDGKSFRAVFRVTGPEDRRYEIERTAPANDDWLCVRFPDDFEDAPDTPGRYRYEILTDGEISEHGELTLRRD